MRRFLAIMLVAPPLALLEGRLAAQPADDAKAKRAAEIEKQIKELEEKIARLRAELAELRPAAKPAPEPPTRGDFEKGGVIKELLQNNGQTSGFVLPDLVVYFRKDTEFLFTDKTNASIADLKVGRSVTVRIDRAALEQKRKPPLAFAYTIVIHPAKGPQP